MRSPSQLKASLMMDRLPEFIANHPFLSSAFVGIVVLLILFEISKKMQGFRELDPIAATTLINRAEAVVIDVRSSGDFQKGHIVNSKNISVENFNPNAKNMVKYKDKALLVYCQMGHRSSSVCKQLIKAGFSQVNSLKGGINAWTEESFPLVKGKK